MKLMVTASALVARHLVAAPCDIPASASLARNADCWPRYATSFGSGTLAQNSSIGVARQLRRHARRARRGADLDQDAVRFLQRAPARRFVAAQALQLGADAQGFRFERAEAGVPREPL